MPANRKSNRKASHKTQTTRSSSTTTQTVTPQERTAALKESIETAAKALAEELSRGVSDKLRSILEFSRRFHMYSVGNQILIASQCPGATQVAGYKTWERLGYQVAKGSKAIWILAPRPYTRRDEDDDGNETVKNGTYFVSVPVFDASQLTPESVEAKPLPTLFTDLGSDEAAHDLARTAEIAIRASGITINHTTQLDPGVQGMSTGGTIHMRRGLNDRNYLQTLIHEWAHELLHKDPKVRAETTRSQRECHAEATAYVVGAHFGLHNEFSSDYLTTWGTTPDGLMAELAMVQRAAEVIITALEGKTAKTGEEVDSTPTAA